MQRKGVIINSGAEIWVPKDEVHDANKKLNLTIGWLSTGKCLNRKLQMRGCCDPARPPSAQGKNFGSFAFYLIERMITRSSRD